MLPEEGGSDDLSSGLLGTACGRSQVNSLEDLTADMLGYPGKVSEITVGDDQFTFAMEVWSEHPKLRREGGRRGGGGILLENGNL
ncbi:hypothetical protein TrRE_jg13586 [Triparma retinervis]|uniref:Uncharacterized protein n=1 Tax=Triparma retinervis TaxID=2557542 RepID=A0A9W7FW10_9STRA|nr:hypothetical protein TrRE_jg13586 [Triparma retinervis]